MLSSKCFTRIPMSQKLHVCFINTDRKKSRNLPQLLHSLQVIQKYSGFTVQVYNHSPTPHTVGKMSHLELCSHCNKCTRQCQQLLLFVLLSFSHKAGLPAWISQGNALLLVSSPWRWPKWLRMVGHRIHDSNNWFPTLLYLYQNSKTRAPTSQVCNFGCFSSWTALPPHWDGRLTSSFPTERGWSCYSASTWALGRLLKELWEMEWPL
jgi:hypothetical protein